MTVEEHWRRHREEPRAEPMPAAASHISQPEVNAQFVFDRYVAGCHPRYRFSVNARVRTASDTTRVAAVALWVKWDAVGKEEMCEVIPDLVLEARTPGESWFPRLERMVEYLRAGVAVVVILDPPPESASVFRPGTRQDTFEKDQTFTLPDVLPGFEVPVARFFEE